MERETKHSLKSQSTQSGHTLTTMAYYITERCFRAPANRFLLEDISDCVPPLRAALHCIIGAVTDQFDCNTAALGMRPH